MHLGGTGALKSLGLYLCQSERCWGEPASRLSFPAPLTCSDRLKALCKAGC